MAGAREDVVSDFDRELGAPDGVVTEAAALVIETDSLLAVEAEEALAYELTEQETKYLAELRNHDELGTPSTDEAEGYRQKFLELGLLT